MLKIPPDAAEICAHHCEGIGLELGAVAIMADHVGCVCSVSGTDGQVSSKTAAAAGMATVMLVEEERKQQEAEEERKRKEDEEKKRRTDEDDDEN